VSLIKEACVTEYKVIVVGTDGSETSLRAVDQAATIAAETGARLIVASAHTGADRRVGGPDPDQLKHEEYRTVGNAPVYELLREAAARAKNKGVSDVEERAIEGAPADALIKLADDTHADLIVVGSVGMNSIVGRLVGSVPQIIRRRARTEVLIINTTD
jgi:nucleotide-binding universal stress UspA family protein